MLVPIRWLSLGEKEDKEECNLALVIICFINLCIQSRKVA